jgi:hypothetical protein
MAQSSTNPIVSGFSGKFGNQIVFRRVNGKIIMANVPNRWNKKPVGKQIETCERFQEASKWAKKKLEDPEMLAAYREKAGNGRSAYNVAIRDYLKPPVVSDIDVSNYHGHAGDKITVTAKKDFRVREVTVTIIGPGGTELEHGTCTPGISWKQWHYTASGDAGNPAGLMVTAVARDYPGNTAKLSTVITAEK